jgi:hypothetical protein
MVVTPDLLCGLHSVVSLCLALQIPVDSSPLDCDPFCHVYGNECSYARINIGTWNLCLIDLNGIHFRIPFYIAQGPGPPLIGNSVLATQISRVLIIS